MSITTQKTQSITRGLSQHFDRGVRSVSNLWSKICTIVDSTSDSEKYGWLGDVYGMKEFLGERQFQELRAMDYELKNRAFEQSHGFERYKIDDDLYGSWGKIAEAIGKAAAQHPDELLIETILAAGAKNCYDGQYFYDTDHSEGASGNQANMGTYTVVSTSAVTVTEFLGSFSTALIAMMKFKSDTNRFFMPRVITGDQLQDFVALVPLSLWEVAVKAMTQFYIAQGSVAVDNVRLATAQVIPVLGMGIEGTGGSNFKWDLLYTGGLIKPFVFQKRAPLKREIKGKDSIEEKVIKFMTEVRYNVGYGLWQYAYRTTFST